MEKLQTKLLASEIYILENSNGKILERTIDMIEVKLNSFERTLLDLNSKQKQPLYLMEFTEF